MLSRRDESVALDTCVKIEQDLLALLMVEWKLLPDTRDLIDPTWFVADQHSELYGAMLELADQGVQPRPRTIIRHLALTGERAVYLNQLMALTPDKASLRYLTTALRCGWQMRQMREVFEAAMEYLDQDKVIDPVKCAVRVLDDIDPILKAGLSDTMRAITAAELGPLIKKTVREAKTKAPDDREGVRTGIASLDDILRPMMPGHLVVCLGRPGQGKSALACTVALNAAKRGVGVMIDSLEMSGYDLGERMVSAIAAEWNETRYRAQVPYSVMSSGDLDEYEERAVNNAADFLATLPITIEQQPGLTVAQIAARARVAHAKYKAQGCKKIILIIDYLGLVRPGEDYRGSKVNEVAEITMNLKVLAKELSIPILLLCQMNRGVEQREDKRPLLSDARDSGSIEQDADTVLGVYREFYYLSQRKESELSLEEGVRKLNCEKIAEIGVLKQRKGQTGWVNVGCNMATNIISG
jgi:replicative DNA helicase